ncbi:MAG: FAD-dependent oxidoreductase, partial [Desulfobacterales bacterium]|nr:FAD-dependent oxidoreductase [Desulfobacterales bacterium]
MPQEKDVTAQESAQRSGNVGAVMVVGGDVAGIQAALDMANSGFYVHLVETKPAIGGVMAQLDKTFPTNDCSMCIISPKLVECGRHLNIEIHTLTDVVAIDGEAGNLSVTLKKQPRYVDPAKCTGCGSVCRSPRNSWLRSKSRDSRECSSPPSGGRTNYRRSWRRP